MCQDNNSVTFVGQSVACLLIINQQNKREKQYAKKNNPAGKYLILQEEGLDIRILKHLRISEKGTPDLKNWKERSSTT